MRPGAACVAAILAGLLINSSAHAQGFPAALEARSVPTELRAGPPRSTIFGSVAVGTGKAVVLTWSGPDDRGDVYLVFRTDQPDAPLAPIAGVVGVEAKAKDVYGPWTLIAVTEERKLTDEVEPGVAQRYAVVTARPPPVREPDGTIGMLSAPAVIGPLVAETSWFNVDRWLFLLITALMAGSLWFFHRFVVAPAPNEVFIRRIPGVDAIEEAVGRSTEMGRPVLYVTGVEEIQNIQTIASLLILGHVAEMTAEYDTDIKVANFFPLTMVVAEEIVRQGFANAGRIDAHKPENVMFISAEQFAFAAGVNGLILRDRPATNIYLGRFFAESLMLAETGYLTGAIQIAGTAEITQLPFFIAACDYTIIGEELYAVSAYMSREPVLLSTLKAADLLKVLIIGVVIVGATAASLGWLDLARWLIPS